MEDIILLCLRIKDGMPVSLIIRWDGNSTQTGRDQAQDLVVSITIHLAHRRCDAYYFDPSFTYYQ